MCKNSNGQFEAVGIAHRGTQYYCNSKPKDEDTGNTFKKKSITDKEYKTLLLLSMIREKSQVKACLIFLNRV